MADYSLPSNSFHSPPLSHSSIYEPDETIQTAEAAPRLPTRSASSVAISLSNTALITLLTVPMPTPDQSTAKVGPKTWGARIAWQTLMASDWFFLVMA